MFNSLRTIIKPVILTYPNALPMSSYQTKSKLISYHNKETTETRKMHKPMYELPYIGAFIEYATILSLRTSTTSPSIRHIVLSEDLNTNQKILRIKVRIELIIIF